MKFLIKNGRVIDPISRTDDVRDILIEDGIITRVEKDIQRNSEDVIDAKGCWVVPGLIDVHVHLREPGFEHKETIETGSKSAAKGGFTTICCMPNTKPPIDDKSVVTNIQQKAREKAVINILPIGAITKGQSGKELVNIPEMVEAGVCGISEDGKTVMNTLLMKKALKKAAEYNKPVFSHCEDHYLAGDGVMNEGLRSRELGLKGISTDSEEIIVARDVFLAKNCGVKLHLCHISTQGTIKILRDAKKAGGKVTAEVCPHHFVLTEKAVTVENTNTKMNPPLRTDKDVEEIKEALKDGTIDIIATDHAPHHENDKKVPYEKAAFGIVGLETAVALTITELVEKGVLTPLQMIEKMSTNPAKLIGIDRGMIKVGKVADITIIDPKPAYKIDVDTFASKGKNSPFHGRKVKGKVVHTIVGGKVVVKDGILVSSK